MITKTFTDKTDIILSIHKSLANGYVIHLTDKNVDEPYDTMAYRLDLEDIDEIIRQLKDIKKLMQ